MEQLKAVILAAGKGTRMKSDLPKVVHTIEGLCITGGAAWNRSCGALCKRFLRE